QTHPLRHIDGAGIDRSGGTGVVDIAPGNDLRFAGGPGVRICNVAAWAGVVGACIWVFYFQRVKNAFAGEGIPRLSRESGNDLAARDEHDVVVAEDVTELVDLRKVARAAQNFVAVKLSDFPDVVGARQRAAMAEEVANGQFALDVAIGKLKLRQ